jgi:plastocyanin
MKSLWFNPNVVHARVGERVVWTNGDSTAHNVTYVSGPKFRSSPRRLRPRAGFSITLTQPGTVRYYCSIHPWMQAEIVVAP